MYLCWTIVVNDGRRFIVKGVGIGATTCIGVDLH